MKALCFILLGLIFGGCARTVSPHSYTLKSEGVKFQYIDITDILTERGVSGAVLIFDEKNNQYYSNDFGLAKTKYSPASTFKIPNTLIGLEYGLIDSNYVFKWSGEKRRVESWNKDLILRDAFQASCVPCYQELARKIGVERMKEGLAKMKYPGMQVREDNIDNFWLNDESKVSQLEQLDFLRRMMVKSFELKASTIQTWKKAAFAESSDAGKLYAKTGLSLNDTDESKGGWYLGFIEKESNRIYFATYLTAGSSKDLSEFMRDRIEVTYDALQFLHYW